MAYNSIMCHSLRSFIKQEVVLCIAVFLGVISVCIVRPAPVQVISGIDFRVLALLFSLMAIIQAYSSIGVLDSFAHILVSRSSSILALYFTLVALVFFSSMAVTNDVALLTFVPLTLIICKKINKSSLFLVVLETLAANLGSSVTPMGNPQNLFLYSYYMMTPSSFFSATLTIGVISAVLLSVLIFITVGGKKNVGIICPVEKKMKIPVAKTLVYTISLIIILLSVFRVVDYKISLAVTVIIIGIFNFKLFRNIDYSLLITFIGFFVFTSTISSVSQVSDFLKKLLATSFSTYITGIITSQFISNVPASLLLSGFTTNSRELLLAVNVGGLGSLIASMASVISYKLYKADIKINEHDSSIVPSSVENIQDRKSPSYIKVFTLCNIVFLVILGSAVWGLFCL